MGMYLGCPSIPVSRDGTQSWKTSSECSPSLHRRTKNSQSSFSKDPSFDVKRKEGRNQESNVPTTSDYFGNKSFRPEGVSRFGGLKRKFGGIEIEFR